MKQVHSPLAQKALPINELFETIQGEGLYTGTPAIFLRLQGCPVGCPWCDTQHTWEHRKEDEIAIVDVLKKEVAAPSWGALSPVEFLAVIQSQGWHAKHVVITGGEPCMYDLSELTEVLYDAGYQCQIETSGTFEVNVHADTWVTVSPKVDMPGGYPILPQAVARANEIKFPVAMQKHVDELDALLANFATREDVIIALQPISQRPRATELAMKTCIERNWRLSVQLHKYLAIA
ncbi:MAG: 7-carboxy-7-deazaguanine synthase QueE [Idiomarinaceae bacterium HL-53]|nr:MAG: 7-carboxy-7-deazaguanine synthase QueE [Idiomarinaceae bacterium HL-53]CUS48801.1 7-carboxy-7-deazaguanine synthase [Idiomarinaceae bacterium HL-53]